MSSPVSDFASRPMRKSAPASAPTQASPVQSAKSGASNVVRAPVTTSCPVTETMRSPFFFAATTRVLRKRPTFFSADTTSSLR